MKITIAKTAGFCMGVRRAVELALDASNRTDDPIYTYGPLIHNPQVLNILEEKGISVIKEIPEKGSGTVLVRAHGVPPEDLEKLRTAGFNVIDATCPKVIKVQSIIAKHSRQGYAVIIVGDRVHPEVIGLLGYAGENGYVAENMDALNALPKFDKAIIVAQTTQNKTFFEEVTAWAETLHLNYQVFNTICDSTESRQEDVKNLAEKVDAVVVVGGYESGNTKRLFDIARDAGKHAVHIETEAELDINQLGTPRHIAITAGASTPNWIIKRVYRELENRMMYNRRGFLRWRFFIHRNLLLSNIYLAIGAGCLTYAAAMLQGIEPALSSILVAVLYLLCMHTFNNLIDITSDRYNDPDRATFYQQNRNLLSALTGLFGLGGLLIAYKMGPLFLLLLLCMSFMGIVYIISLVPQSITGGFKPKIRDIPGSKTVLVAMAWGIVTTIVPALDGFGQIRLVTVLIFSWTVSLVLVRTAFFDILDMQGSRIVGKETIPILLGEKKTMGLLKNLAGLMMIVLCIASAVGAVSTLGYLLSICPLSMLMFLSAYERGGIPSGFRQGFLMESHFILAGLLAGLWALI
ncbi:MAG: 4-hydroxy-3-methylbut-2-enyl diphosphate reductase [Desulfobacteraceae bacterium]|nr:4-hydroxy-3-methylbut-2-enyl diphosphate reductase [Desulfobacteraceae bacterium]MBC2755549.1 4-hydroxy-3-methylbut-2-enyl diphosphate reductase [Desulfobacteraceae bacterium]